MKIPKVEFEYSWVYDDYLRSLDKPPKEWKTLTGKDMKKFIRWAEPRWRKREQEILAEMSKITMLSWSEEKIKCYVVAWAMPFSSPLTIPMYIKKEERFFDVLAHELIHNLFFQERNEERTKNAWKYFLRHYSKEKWNTRIHIPLHAIHEHIFRTFYDEKHLLAEYEWCRIKGMKPYQRSWDIVRRDGYQNIIQEFAKRIEK